MSIGRRVSLSLSLSHPRQQKKEEHEDEERANGDEKTDERAVRLITVTATGGGAIDYGDIIVPNWPARWKTSKEISKKKNQKKEKRREPLAPHSVLVLALIFALATLKRPHDTP